MLLNLSHIGQIALPVIDVDRAEAFYENIIGLRKLYRFGDLSFFDSAGAWRQVHAPSSLHCEDGRP